jgi:hypothetical protein
MIPRRKDLEAVLDFAEGERFIGTMANREDSQRTPPPTATGITGPDETSDQ